MGTEYVANPQRVAAELKEPQGFNHNARSAIAGALGCSDTYGAFTPVDLWVGTASRRLPASTDHM